jgi:hypothetical protein
VAVWCGRTRLRGLRGRNSKPGRCSQKRKSGAVLRGCYPAPLPAAWTRAPRRVKTRDQLRGALRAARRCARAARRSARRLMPRVPPPVCGPAFGSCSGGASGGDAWASASDTVNTVTSAGAAARLNVASPRRENAFRRDITSDVPISDLRDFRVDERIKLIGSASEIKPRGRAADWAREGCCECARRRHPAAFAHPCLAFGRLR